MTTRVPPISSSVPNLPPLSASRWGFRTVVLLGLGLVGLAIVLRRYFHPRIRPDLPPPSTANNPTADLNKRFLETLFSLEVHEKIAFPFARHAAGIFTISATDLKINDPMKEVWVECSYKGQVFSTYQMTFRSDAGGVWEALVPDMPFAEQMRLQIHTSEIHKPLAEFMITAQQTMGIYELDRSNDAHPQAPFTPGEIQKINRSADEPLAIILNNDATIGLSTPSEPVKPEAYITIKNLSGRIHLLFFRIVARHHDCPNEVYRVPVVVFPGFLNLPKDFLRKGWEITWAYHQFPPIANPTLELIEIQDASASYNYFLKR